MTKLTIPQIRHCLLALAAAIDEGGADAGTGAILRYLAEETKRAPRRSKKGDEGIVTVGDEAAPADTTARALGREDGLRGVRDHAARYPAGAPGHGDYVLGWVEGEGERREHSLADEARAAAG